MFQIKEKLVPARQESRVASAFFDGPRTGLDNGDLWQRLWEQANELTNEPAWDAFLAGDDDEKREVAWLLNP